jgi:hypothetical protein
MRESQCRGQGPEARKALQVGTGKSLRSIDSEHTNAADRKAQPGGGFGGRSAVSLYRVGLGGVSSVCLH